MNQTLRTAQPLLEEKQLMLVSAMAQQSCFTARNYFVQPQLINSCCACLEVSARGSTGAQSPLRPIWGRAKGREQRKRQKWKEPHMGSDPIGALCRG